MNENEQSTSKRRDRGTISRRSFVANAALIGAGLAAAPLLGCDNERPTRENSGPANGPTRASGGNSMETRPLGTRKLGALEVSALGHGGMSISANYGSPADRNQGINVIRAAAANRPFVELLKRVAEKKNATPAQIALAWLLVQKPFIVPIPGTRNIDHLTENLAAAQVELTPADLREIETASASIKVHGGRMNEEQMKAVDK